MSGARGVLMRMFGHPEGVLGRLGGIIMARTNHLAAKEVIGLLDVRAADQVLEIGFGPGVGIKLVAERVTDGCVAGIDSSREMVAQATARNSDAVAGGRVDLRHGTAQALPFADGTFDKALAINSMQVWPDAGSGLQEIRRVLRAGGKVALGFTAYSGQPKDGVTELLTTAGFTEVQMVDGKNLFCALASKP
jgi:ubiquinone/menaquinone biosynthesis C-methylase UbiE